jgi:hypothetical protein
MQDVMELLPLFVAESRTLRYARRTASAVRAFCDWHIRQYGSTPQVSDLTFAVFVRYFHWLDAITTPSTFNLRRHWLKGFCDWAVLKGWLLANPIDRVPCAKRPLGNIAHRRAS